MSPRPGYDRRAVTALRRHHRLLPALVLGLLGAVLATAAATGDVGVAAMAPFACLVVPLLLGRYVGAGTLTRLRSACAPRPRRRTRHVALAPGRQRPLLLLYSGLLLASGLATRPPPAAPRAV